MKNEYKQNGKIVGSLMNKYYGRDMGSSSMNFYKQKNTHGEDSVYGLNSPKDVKSSHISRSQNAKRLDKVQVMHDKL